MAKFTIDMDYFDIESGEILGDMCFYFETTIEESIWRNSAKEMQESFIEGFNGGDIGSEIENPEIHNVCEVVDEFGMIDFPKISNIVLLQNQRDLENQIRQMVSQKYPQSEIKVWYR